MNAKYLRAAAEAANKHCDSGGMPYCWVDLVKVFTSHILATVHADDEEPVTVEFCDELGLPYDSIGRGHRLYGLTGGLRLAAEACPVGFKPCVFWMGFGDQFREIKHPTRGQLRHLLAGLGMENNTKGKP